jgi:hypothetical protein
MPKKYPSRLADRWEHALLRPINRSTDYELIEVMRGDLFEFLDVITTSPYSDATYRREKIQLIADRLVEITPIRAAALRRAYEQGTVERDDGDRELPKCGPFSVDLWRQLGKRWAATFPGFS